MPPKYQVGQGKNDKGVSNSNDNEARKCNLVLSYHFSSLIKQLFVFSSK